MPQLPVPGPLKANHNILPPDTWASLSPLQTGGKPPSDERDGRDGPLLQRQSSGYSSENELQQIENNAENIKNRKSYGKVDNVVPNCQEFIPVNQSSDLESTTDEWADSFNNEPVYMNQPVHPTRSKNQEPFGFSTSHPSLPQNTNTSTNSVPDQSPPQRQMFVSHTNLAVPDDVAAHKSPTSIPHPSSFTTVQQQYHLQQNIQQRLDQNHIPEHNNSNQNRNHPPTNSSHPQASFLPLSHSQSNTNTFHQAQSPAFLSFLHDPSEHKATNIEPVHTPIIQNQPLNSRPQSTTTSNHVASNVFLPEDEVFTCHTNSPPLAVSECRFPTQSHLHSSRSMSSESREMTSLDIAQMLEVPFETSIISDESGDRLSTLV